MDRVAQLKDVQDEARALFKKKNADYGDSFATYGPVGVLVRMGDKISRLNSITQKGVHLVNTESLRDTLVDLHNYAAMAVLLLDEGKDIVQEHSVQKIDNIVDSACCAAENANKAANLALKVTRDAEKVVAASSYKTTRVDELKNEKNANQENQVEFMRKVHTLRGFTEMGPY